MRKQLTTESCLLTVFAKSSTLDVRLGSEYASTKTAVRTCSAVSSEDYGNSSGKHLMGVLSGKVTEPKQGLNQRYFLGEFL